MRGKILLASTLISLHCCSCCSSTPQNKYLDNVSERRLLLVELSLYNDVLNTLKTACMTLEGDGALAHKVGTVDLW